MARGAAVVRIGSGGGVATGGAGLAGAAAAYALAAFALGSGVDGLVKLLSASYHPVQLAFLGALFGLVPVLSLTLARGGLARLRTRRPGLHALRGGCACLGSCATIVAFAELPLADAYAVLFTLPLLVTALSVPLLGERVGQRRWAAVATGFAGVLVMVRPGGAIEGIGALAAGSAALFGALAVMAVRRLQRTETTEACATYGNLGVVLGTGAALPWIYVPPSVPDLALSAAAGILGACSLLLSLRAYRLAPASALAPLQYSQMPYGLLLGWLMFGTSPEPTTLVGAAVVVASGACVLRREPVGGRAG